MPGLKLIYDSKRGPCKLSDKPSACVIPMYSTGIWSLNSLRPGNAYICVSKLASIISDNGLLPGRCLAIIWTNAGILLIGHLGTNFSENLIGIQTFSLKKCPWKCRLLNGVHFVSTSMCSSAHYQVIISGNYMLLMGNDEVIGTSAACAHAWLVTCFKLAISWLEVEFRGAGITCNSQGPVWI